MEPDTDAAELAAAEWALAQAGPSSAYAKGCSFFAIAAGGDIYQDLYAGTGSQLQHMLGTAGRQHPTHEVFIVPGFSGGGAGMRAGAGRTVFIRVKNEVGGWAAASGPALTPLMASLKAWKATAIPSRPGSAVASREHAARSPPGQVGIQALSGAAQKEARTA